MQELNYLTGDRYFHNHEPQTVWAEPFVKIGDNANDHLEGICFDRSGKYAYFVAIGRQSVMRLNIETKEANEVYHNEMITPVSVKVHKDGRLFICSCNWCGGYAENSFKPGIQGGIFAINPDGTNFTPILQGWCVDDLVFDSLGGFYFTHFIGNLNDPCGGVYYVTPDYMSVKPIVRGLRCPNGVALSKDEKILWITEMLTGNIIRYNLFNAGHCNIVYHADGGTGVDSCSIDDDDNVYVAHVRAGRIIVLNHVGCYIAQILIPGREDGHCLHSSHPMVIPGKKELYITAADERTEDTYGSWIFKAPAFAVGNTHSYQFK